MNMSGPRDCSIKIRAGDNRSVFCSKKNFLVASAGQKGCHEGLNHVMFLMATCAKTCVSDQSASNLQFMIFLYMRSIKCVLEVSLCRNCMIQLKTYNQVRLRSGMK